MQVINNNENYGGIKYLKTINKEQKKTQIN